MNESSSIRTNSLSSKSALPPFQIRGLEQILFHKDAFANAQGRPKSSHALLQQWTQSSLRPQTSYNRRSFPLPIEAGSASNTDSSTHEKETSHGKATRRTSIGDRNVQVLRAINDVLMSQVDSLRQQLEETSHMLRERQLDLSYISEIELLAKDEIAELRQQLREKEEIIKGKDEIIRGEEEMLRQKDKLIRQKEAGISENPDPMIMKRGEIREANKEIPQKRISDKEIEKRTPINNSSHRTSTSRFREQDCPVFSDPNSELDLSTNKQPLSKQSNLAKGRHALKEMLREQREVRTRKAAIKANIRASKVEEKERESRRVSEAQSRASEASRRPGLSNDENGETVNGGRTKSFVRLKSFVGGRRPRMYPST